MTNGNHLATFVWSEKNLCSNRIYYYCLYIECELDLDFLFRSLIVSKYITFYYYYEYCM